MITHVKSRWLQEGTDLRAHQEVRERPFIARGPNRSEATPLGQGNDQRDISLRTINPAPVGAE